MMKINIKIPEKKKLIYITTYNRIELPLMIQITDGDTILVDEKITIEKDPITGTIPSTIDDLRLMLAKKYGYDSLEINLPDPADIGKISDYILSATDCLNSNSLPKLCKVLEKRGRNYYDVTYIDVEQKSDGKVSLSNKGYFTASWEYILGDDKIHFVNAEGSTLPVGSISTVEIFNDIFALDFIDMKTSLDKYFGKEVILEGTHPIVITTEKVSNDILSIFTKGSITYNRNNDFLGYLRWSHEDIEVYNRTDVNLGYRTIGTERYPVILRNLSQVINNPTGEVISITPENRVKLLQLDFFTDDEINNLYGLVAWNNFPNDPKIRNAVDNIIKSTTPANPDNVTSKGELTIELTTDNELVIVTSGHHTRYDGNVIVDVKKGEIVSGLLETHYEVLRKVLISNKDLSKLSDTLTIHVGYSED